MKRFVTLFALAAVCGALWAEGSPEPEFEFVSPRIFGADAAVSWGTLKLGFGAGWEAFSVGRELATGRPLDAGETLPSYALANGVLRLSQAWVFDQEYLWVASGVLAHGDPASSAPSGTFQTDLDGGVFGFFQAGAASSRLKVNAHQVVSGSRAEVSAEAGPALLSLRSTDYYKLRVVSEAFLTLWDLEGGPQLFSGTLALRGDAQWIDGASVPLLLREWTEVRGYQRLLDTKFRSVATAELRVGLPSLVGAADLVPVIFAFGEGGWYAGYSGAPAAYANRSGLLASVGAGLGFTLWGLTTPTISWALPLAEESALWWTVSFNYEF